MTRRRRQFIAALGAGALGTVAGCSSQDDGTDEPADANDTQTDEPVSTTDSEADGETPTAEPTEEPTPALDSTPTDKTALASADPETATDALTLRGDVTLGGAEAGALRVQYRQVPDIEWTHADPVTVEEDGVHDYEVTGLEPRRLFQYRVVLEVGDEEFGTPVGHVATDGPSDGDSEGPESSAPHDLADGFVDVAPWLDDSTPIVTITDLDSLQLRLASGAAHPRVVVFETSGVVDLEGGKFEINSDKCWVAGQTAPSPGVTFIKGDVLVSGDDVVVQHLRSRPGDAGRTGEWQNGAFSVKSGSKNVVFDHLTATWSIDENLSVGYPGTGEVTISNCLIAEALHNSLHPKGRHGYGSIASPQQSDNTAHMGNVWALNSARNPRSGAKGFYGNCLSFYFERAARLDDDAENAFIGHAFVDPVNGTEGCIQNGYVYTEDCVTEPEGVPLTGNLQGTLDQPPLMPDGFESIPGAETEQAALEHVGARPTDRTEIDERIVGQIRDRDGHYIDSQSEVGGYPDLPENTHELEIPDEGLRAWLREQARAVEP